MTDIGLLLEMLTYRRPMGSATELEFRKRFIPEAFEDDHGNLHVWIANADGSPSRVLWSCHTDTVHKGPGRQTLTYDAISGIVHLSNRSRKQGSNCLGADDTAGVFICVQLIAANVPGHYVFHYGEERGGIGSGNLSQSPGDLLDNAEIAIALDRRGTSDVITFQYGWRSASERFAQSLCRALKVADPSLKYAPTHGVYTDTAEYTGLIPECSNLSVGYLNEHRSDELLMTKHTLRLLEALKVLDTASLEVDREPEDPYQGYMFVADTPDYDRKPSTIDLCMRCGHTEKEHDTPETDCTYCLCEAYLPEEDDYDTVSLYLDPEYADIQRSLRKINREDPAVQSALRRAQDDTRAQAVRGIVLSWPKDDPKDKQ